MMAGFSAVARQAGRRATAGFERDYCSALGEADACPGTIEGLACLQFLP
jgi:hypothetical protein